MKQAIGIREKTSSLFLTDIHINSERLTDFLQKNTLSKENTE
jgi:hypothetical protein